MNFTIRRHNTLSASGRSAGVAKQSALAAGVIGATAGFMLAYQNSAGEYHTSTAADRINYRIAAARKVRANGRIALSDNTWTRMLQNVRNV